MNWGFLETYYFCTCLNARLSSHSGLQSINVTFKLNLHQEIYTDFEALFIRGVSKKEEVSIRLFFFSSLPHDFRLDEPI